MKLAIVQSPRSCGVDIAGCRHIASPRKRKPRWSEVACPRFSARERKSMRWADGFIAVDWGTTNRRAYRLDCAANAPTNSRTERASVGRKGQFPAAVAEIRDRLGDKPLLMAGMVGSNRGWAEAPYVPCPPGSTNSRGKLAGPVSAKPSSRACPMSGTAAPMSCAARKCSCSAPSRPARSSPWPGLPSRHPQQMGDLRGRHACTLPHGDDRRAVQPLEDPQHPLGPAQRHRRAQRCLPRRRPQGPL